MSIKKYLPEFVYGATDGTVTTFAIISGAVGASLGLGVIIILGFANLFADGISMAISNYLSTKSSNSVTSLSKKNPIKTAFATFVSFVVVGFIPLIAFVIAPLHLWLQSNQFIISIVCTAIAFLAIGWIKSGITSKSRFMSMAETLIMGAIASGIAYGVGYLLRNIAG